MHNATMDGRGREKAAEEGTRGNPNYNQNRIRKPEAKKNKAPPQPPVLHSQDTAEREDEGNSNQPEEDMGNTTPQNEAEANEADEAEEPGTSERPMERSCKEKKTQNNRNKP